MYDFNFVSCVYVCWSVLLADGVLAGRFCWQVSFFCLKHGLNARVFERERCRTVVRTVCSF